MKLKIFQIIILTTILLTIFLMPYSVDAYSYDGFEITTGYNFILNEEVAHISGYTGKKSNVVIPSYILGYKVVEIENKAFYNCSSLQSVSIPDSITRIGESAFKGCFSLQSISIPDSVTYIDSYAFSGCSSLTSVKLPSSLSQISNGTFLDCSMLKSITLPNSVTKIISSAFKGCSTLESISIPDDVTSIGSYAFSECSSLTSVKLPSSLSQISENTFSDCSALKSITLPNSVTIISNNAFSGCSALKSITLPNSVTIIRSNAFSGCSALESISIPESITYIGNRAFANCTKLEEIKYNAISMEDLTDTPFYNTGTAGEGITVTFGSSVKKIPAYLFRSFTTDGYANVCSVSIPESVTYIGNYAFADCTKLKKINYNAVSVEDFSNDSMVFYNAGTDGEGITVTFGSSVKKIPAYLFSSFITDDYANVHSVSIPDSVTSIGNYAFANCCITQTKLILPKTLETIGEGAFGGWKSLEEIKMPFVGAKRGISGTTDSVFGYIFGTTSDTTVGVYQQCGDGGQNYLIPNSLRKVTITDDTYIPYGAFQNCSFLTDIIIDGSPSTIMPYAFSGLYNLFNVYVKNKTVKYSSDAFKYSEFPTLYGFTDSTTETFANDNSFDFVSIDDMEAGIYNISAKAQVIENNIVFNVKTDKIVYDKMVHIAIYDNTQSLSDYIIVPNYNSFNEVNVIFKNNPDISYAKVFLWESLYSITPITEALKININ